MPSIKTESPAELNNYWLILHNCKKVFAPVSKNANTSIKRALLQGQENTEFAPKDTVLSDYQDYEVVAIVRNPFDRLVSCYEFFTKTQPQYRRKFDFPEFYLFSEFVEKVAQTPDEISNKHFRSQYNLLSQDGEFLPSILIDFDEIEKVKEHLPIKKLGCKHKTNHGSYKGYYGELDQRLVEKRFSKDLNFFNYRF